MLRRVTCSRQTVCRCLLQNSGFTGCTTQQTRNTAVLERVYPVNLVKKGGFPHLKRKNKVLKLVEDENTRPLPDIECILTDYVKGIGLKGQVLEVDRSLFRNELFPAGKALYPTKENIEDFGHYADIMKEDPLLTVTAKEMIDSLSGFFLQIPMSSENAWVLNKSHVRIACRVMGVVLPEEYIILPEEPVTEHKDIVIGIQYGTLQAKMRARIYPVTPNSSLDDSMYPEIWDNPPVDSDTEPVS